MAQIDPRLTTGLDGVDRMLKGLIRGDNIVWQIDRLEEYRPFVEPYCSAAEEIGEPLVYIRFARHEPLVAEGPRVRVCRLDPHAGFEGFVTGIHRVIEETGRGGYYVFDCLSELAEAWQSDQMLGNFFMLTCPYLYDVEAIAYFALRRNQHSFHATRAVMETTQIFLEVHQRSDELFVHPWKVQSRHSPTMHMLHAWNAGDFRPVTDSATIAEVRHTEPWLQSESNQAGIWTRAFGRASAVANRGRDENDPEVQETFQRLLRMSVTRDERLLAMCEKYMTLADVLEIGKRMVGTGLIGGKSVGMLLARAILCRNRPRWKTLLERHDSFYIGSDVFYTYLVRNGIWALRERVRDPQRYLEGAERARQRMLIGTFPDPVRRQFEDMLDYFGQSPIIVRSSSLLEDNFGNAFAGKYESIFCANQGSRHQRLEDFLAAVRTIYASTMSEKALKYRALRGLLDCDEQMALLVQRVSGSMYDNLFFPQVAGVGFSFNPYVWNPEIDPKAGMMRIVFGMGTRAVDRSDEDYTRVVALNAPHRRPEDNFRQVRRYSQKRVDVLDMTSNQLVSARFRDVAKSDYDLPMGLLASPDEEVARRLETGDAHGATPYVLTFDQLFSDTEFVTDIRELLSVLQSAYDYPVDVEFTANFVEDAYRINLLQCRPLQTSMGGAKVAAAPEKLPADRIVLRARNAVIGRGQVSPMDSIVYVHPRLYADLPLGDRHGIARMIGRVCRHEREQGRNILLIGPGRWGTTTPSLGVPVRFSEIDQVSAICELVTMGENFSPDASLGTHFFSDLIEADILYFALYPDRNENYLDRARLEAAPNRLAEVEPGCGDLAEVVRLIDGQSIAEESVLTLWANPMQQSAICYLSPLRKHEE